MCNLSDFSLPKGCELPYFVYTTSTENGILLCSIYCHVLYVVTTCMCQIVDAHNRKLGT